jgi:hypothetical protein
MGRDVGIDLILTAECNQESLQKIFERGSAIGCRYADPTNLAKLGFNGPIITTEHAVAYIMNNINEQRKSPKSGRNIPIISFYYFNTTCSLIFGERALGEMRILCDIVRGSWWLKGDPDLELIDWERYIKLMFDICQDFPILMLKTDDSYFEPQY